MAELHYRFWNRYAREYLYEPTARAASIALLIPVMLVLVYLLIISPLLRSIKEKRGQIGERVQATDLIKERSKNIEKLKSVYEGAEEQRTKLDLYIPNDINMGMMIQELSIISSTHGFQLLYFIPSARSEKVGKSTSYESSVNIGVSGNLQNTLAFIKSLEEFERFYGINSVDIKRLSDGVNGTIELSVSVFALKKG
ncbi:type 4a pilus biogenesis protein PilO [candidate division WWE3 bacterium]|nr:type 4a pilus biogenesis protein PilO [candidate division WWE3 bacterium]